MTDFLSKQERDELLEKATLSISSTEVDDYEWYQGEGFHPCGRDAEYIIAMSPNKAIKLLDQIDALEGQVKAAFEEAFEDGYVDGYDDALCKKPINGNSIHAWNFSKSKAALAGAEGE